MILHPKKPCAECPWRRDVPTGRFPPERYRALASTAYDMGGTMFACHKSQEGKEAACAGFLLMGAAHNMVVRMNVSAGHLNPRSVSDGGYPLFRTYRQMAIANGVKRNDPALRNCRDDTQW